MDTFIKQTSAGFEVHTVSASTVYATLTNRLDAEKIAALIGSPSVAAVAVKKKGGRPAGSKNIVTKTATVDGVAKNRGGRPKKNRDLELAIAADNEAPVLELAHNAPYDGGEKVDEIRLAALVGAPS